MSEHTPTTDQVRRVFARDGIGAVSEANGNRFDRWHTVEIRKAKAEGIRAAASACRTLLTMQMGEALPHEMLEEMDRMAERFGAPR